MKAAILKIVESRDDIHTIKKVKRAIQSSDEFNSMSDDDFSTKFDKALKLLINKGKLEYEGKNIVCVSKKLSKRKHEDVDDGATQPEISHVDTAIIPKLKKRKAEIEVSNENATDILFDEVDSVDNVTSSNSKFKSMKGMYPELWRTGEQLWRDNAFNPDYLLQNPDGITRIFCGNLNKNVTEDQLRGFIEDIVYIKWITDKETQQFYGSTFLEMKDAKAACTAVMKDKQKFLGRPLKLYYCPPRPNDVWPPRNDGSASTSIKPPIQKAPQMTEKPENCRKLYCGNLSYNIDDESMVEFFKDCGTLVGLRWLTHKDSGDFRGCGFVEFETTKQADEAIKLNGKELLGR